MYKVLRRARILISLLAMLVPMVALVAGYRQVFERMQMLTAIISGSLVCLIFWLAATLIYGRIYCSTVCPLGTSMDCSAALWKLTIMKNSIYRYHEANNTLRISSFAAAIALILLGGAVLPTLLDPYSAYARMVSTLIVWPVDSLLGRSIDFGLASAALALLYLVAIVVCTRRRGRLVCNTACPAGDMLGLVSRFSVYHTEIDPEKCIRCGKCEDACKCECINLKDLTVDNTRCVVCFNCMDACPNDAIAYRAGRHRLRMPLMQPTNIAPSEITNPNTTTK